MTATATQTTEARIIASAYVYEETAGLWIVQDETDSRGGLFANREAALKFARHEFGSDTEIVMMAPATQETVAAPSYLQLVSATVRRYVERGEQAGRDITDTAAMKGCWDAAAQLLLQDHEMAGAGA